MGLPGLPDLEPLVRDLCKWLTLPTLAVYLFYTEFLSFPESLEVPPGFTLFPALPFQSIFLPSLCSS